MLKTQLGNHYLKTLCYMLIFIFMLCMSGCKGNVNTPSTDAAANGTGQSFPMTITDDLGRNVVLKAASQRIVSLAPSNTEILFYLGLGDRVVGDTTFCDYPEEAKSVSKIGGFSDPSIEKIVALKPDLVLATDMHESIIKQLDDAGLNVLVLSPNTIDQIIYSMQLVGKAAGIESKATDLTKSLQDRISAVSYKLADIAPDQRPTVYYEMWDEPLMTVGQGSLISDIIRLAGGINITDDINQQYPQISEEVIIEKNPQVMINSYGHDNQLITPAQVAARKGWQGIAFVKNNRIYTIDSDLLGLAGPRIVDGLEQMAADLHPELFK